MAKRASWAYTLYVRLSGRTFVLGFSLIHRPKRKYDARRRAIAETSAFLTWALSTDQQMPRIPRRRVDRGGFGELLKREGASTLISYWWSKALDRVKQR